MKEIIKQLKAPFKECEIEWRVQSSGKSGSGFWAMVMPYVQNRAIMDRLDEVVGADKWKNELSPVQGGFICGISILYNKEWITKWDGADNTAIEATKGGISNAMKRSAVQWGMGRYLYHLDVEFAETTPDKTKGYRKAKTKNKETFYWKVPTLPKWAVASEKIELELERLSDATGRTIDHIKSMCKEKFDKVYADITAEQKKDLFNTFKGV